MTKRDINYAIITGFTTGLIAWLVLRYLKIAPGQSSLAWLPLAVPVLWILGVQFGYLLGRRIGFFNEFGKFVAIGFTNFAVDAGVLNLLIATTGISLGFWYAVFKTISFVVAVTHSYFWNRTWTFQSQGQTRQEYTRFMAVMIAVALVNVIIASVFVNFVPFPDSISPELWANIGAVVGSACALVLSFIGFRIIVFK